MTNSICCDCSRTFCAPNKRQRCDECRFLHRSNRPSRQRKERGPFTCKHCAIEYTTRRSPGEGEAYCSRDCAFKDKSAIKELRREYRENHRKVSYTVFRRLCAWCDVRFTAIRKDARYCSGACRTRVSDEAHHKRSTAKHEAECTICKVEFCRMYGEKSQTCSDPCRIKAARSDGYGRARCRGSEAIRFNIFDIFERDKWRCNGCGVKTPLRLRGTYDDDAPELDHVIPISKGGPHTKENTQCLCRACNRSKGAGSLNDQLIMFG